MQRARQGESFRRALARPGSLLLLFAGFSVAIHLWIKRSLLVPIVGEENVEYVFVSAPLSGLVRLALMSCGLVFAGHLLVRRLAAQRAEQPPIFAPADVSYASPLLCFAASALALLNLQPQFAHIPPVWSYVIVDLSRWWTVLLIAWLVVNVDGRLHGALRARVSRLSVPPHVRRWGATAALLAIAVTCVVVGTPGLRFTGTTIGDESRYLRYCELWYQGLGFEISHIKPIAELPPDFRPKIGRNFKMLATELPRELRSLAFDSATFLRDPSHRFSQVEGEGRFFTGKNGRVYQVHQPGISFLMFPAYYIDRQLAGANTPAGMQWPAQLVSVNAFFLLLYAIWTALIFRLLRRSFETVWVPWITTLAVVLSMPVAAFPFQIYPELAAGVLIFAVAIYLLFDHQRGALGVSFFYGLLAGYLPWLHVRFSLVAATLAVTGVVTLRNNRQRLVAFLIGCAVPVACLTLYAYRLTGSILPTAMWPPDEQRGVVSLFAMIRNAPAYLLDRDWGLFAYAPVYLLALPGCWWLARRRPDIFLVSGALFLALLLPAAGHSLSAAGATPMRLIVAVVPLAALSVAEVLARHGRSRLLQIVFGLLFVVSVQNAFAYNNHHAKHLMRFVDQSFSGWKFNLLFPADADQFEFSSGDGALLAGWLVIVITLPVMAALIDRAQRRPRIQRSPVSTPSAGALAVAVTVAAVLLATAVSAAAGLSRHPRYQMTAQAAELAIAERMRDDGRSVVAWSSTRGRLRPPS